MAGGKEPMVSLSFQTKNNNKHDKPRIDEQTKDTKYNPKYPTFSNCQTRKTSDCHFHKVIATKYLV